MHTTCLEMFQSSRFSKLNRFRRLFASDAMEYTKNAFMDISERRWMDGWMEIHPA